MPKIVRRFRTFDQMEPGKTLLLINDRDPKPLYYQFAAERAGQFEWNYLEREPQIWKVEIGKKGGGGCATGISRKPPTL